MAGGKLPKLQNYNGPGSLLRKFELVTGVKGFNLTMLRKGLDGKIHSREGLRSSSKDLNSHSSVVGAAVYDTMSSARRTLLMNHVDAGEGGSQINPEFEASAEHVAKRAKIDEEENKKMKDKADKFLEYLKNRSPPDFSPTGINESDLQLLRELFSVENEGII